MKNHQWREREQGVAMAGGLGEPVADLTPHRPIAPSPHHPIAPSPGLPVIPSKSITTCCYYYPIEIVSFP